MRSHVAPARLACAWPWEQSVARCSGWYCGMQPFCWVRESRWASWRHWLLHRCCRTCCMARVRVIRWCWRWFARRSRSPALPRIMFRPGGPRRSIPWWRCGTSERAVMVGLFQDIRDALRQLRRAPGFAVAATIVLGLGIGSTTGMLAVVQSVLMRPLNYPDADRLVLVGVSNEADSGSQIDFPTYQEMKRTMTGVTDLAAYSSLPVPAQTDGGTKM